MYRFEHPEYFWLLLTFPLVFFLYFNFIKWKRSRIARLGNRKYSQNLLVGRISGRATSKLILIMLSVLFSIFGLANLQAGDQSATVQSKGIDIVFALDVSKSMLAKDVNPDRLTKAKLLIQTVLDKMDDNRVGLVIFAGRAYVQSPLTSDFGSLRMMIQAANSDLVPTQGTALAEAISMSVEDFGNKNKQSKALILISDGEDHEPEAVKAAKEATDNNIVIHTIGVGTANGAEFIDPATNNNKLDNNGNVVISKLNEPALQEIAQAGNGSYQLLTNVNQVAQNLNQEIDKLEAKTIEGRSFLSYKSYYQYFLGFAVILLMLSLVLPNAKRNEIFELK
ncbi:MAG TPA: VWA domain-containing protein [Edaphocola sp.]|nr:VWA domain-containing protein [Edaphocola sp.]